MAPVEGGPSDTEQLSQPGGAALTGPVEGDEVRLLSRVEFGLLAPKSAPGLDHLHPLPDPQTDEVGLEPRDHRQDCIERRQHGHSRVVGHDRPVRGCG